MGDFLISLWDTLNQDFPVIGILIKVVVIIAPLMLLVAYFTYAERKIIGYMQIRIGPNRVGPRGWLQPIADAVKLMFKEIIIPSGANKVLFMIAPMISITTALAAWAVFPFDDHLILADVNAGLLYILAVASMGVYGVLIAGWASNSKYALLSAMRSAAQVVSYEIAMGFALVAVIVAAGSLNLGEIVRAQAGGILALVLAAPATHVRHLLHLRGRGDQPGALRRGRGRVRDRGRFSCGILRDGVRHLLPGGIRQHDHDLGPGGVDVPGWLAVAFSGHYARSRFRLGTGIGLVFRQGLRIRVLLSVVAGDLSPLPL